MDHPPSRIEALDALAGTMAELARSDPQALAARLADLSPLEQAELALRLPPKERLEVLLHAAKPMALVRSIPDFDLYLTIREVGPIDALPLLSLASASQLTHILDLESWRGDRFDPDRCGAWVALLAEAGEPLVKRFLNNADDELLMLLFREWARVRPLEIDHEEPVDGHGMTEAGDDRGSVSPDGHHAFAPALAEHGPAVRRLAEVFFREQQHRYMRVLWECRAMLPAELEEDALRFRQGRLEEHGFPPPEEALAIYAPPAATPGPLPAPLPAPVPGGLAGPRGLTIRASRTGILAAATDRLSGDLRETVLHGVVSLANHVLTADGADPGDPAAHRSALERAAAYVGLALETRGAVDPDEAAGILGTIPAIELFREGYARAAALQHRASVLSRTGWASRHPRALDLLEPPLRARLRALAVPRPLYVDETAEETGRFRDFRSLREIDVTRAAIDLAERLGAVLVERIGFPADAATGGATFSTLLLTALAWHAVTGETRGERLPFEVAETFARDVASRRTAPAGAPEAALHAWLLALEAAGTFSPSDAAPMRVFGGACLDRLRKDLGDLAAATPVTPLTAGCLWLATV